jgi:hypothetical protein
MDVSNFARTLLNRAVTHLSRCAGLGTRRTTPKACAKRTSLSETSASGANLASSAPGCRFVFICTPLEAHSRDFVGGPEVGAKLTIFLANLHQIAYCIDKFKKMRFSLNLTLKNAIFEFAPDIFTEYNA